MSQRVLHGFPGRFAALAGVLVTLCVSLALFASSASASSSYCGGQNLNGFEYCFGAARDVSEVTGYGEQHSVCVGIGAEAGHCSSGPKVVAKFNKGVIVHEEPWIQNNAAGNNVVFGTAFP